MEKESASSVPKSPAESRRPSNSSERDVSFAHEGFEYVGIVTAAVTDVAACINPCRTTERKAKIRRQKVVAIQACSRDLRSISSRDEEEEKERQKRDVGKRGTKFGRRAALKWRTPGHRKKIHTDVAWRRGQIHVPQRVPTTPFTATHRGANDNSSAWQRPSYRSSRCFMHGYSRSFHSPSAPFPDPLQPPFKRSSSDPAVLPPQSTLRSRTNGARETVFSSF